jgi:cell wall-associated NlpC family hydrolase
MLSLKNLKLEPLNVEGFTEAENRTAEDFIEVRLKEWEGTPYMAGKHHKGRGVDCVHFVTAIYDDILGSEHLYETLPQDMSFHDKGGAEAGLRRMFRFYPCSPVEGDILQPGDIVICGPIGLHGGPGHGMIAGKDSLWHVNNLRVCRTGLGIAQTGTAAFKQIRRLDDRTVLRRNL